MSEDYSRNVEKEPDFSTDTKIRELGQKLRFGWFRKFLARRGFILFQARDEREARSVGETLIIRDVELQEQLRQAKGFPAKSSAAIDLSGVRIEHEDGFYSPPVYDEERNFTVNKVKSFANGRQDTISALVCRVEVAEGKRRAITTKKATVAQFNGCVKQIQEGRAVSTLSADEFEDIARRELVDDLHKAQDTATLWSRKCPVSQAAVEAHVHYTVGLGINIVCPDVDVAEFIQQFWDYNDMKTYAKEFFRTMYLNGEIFLVHFPEGKDQDFMDQIRWVSPRQITNIITFEDDVSMPLVYRRDIPSLKTIEPIFYPDVWTAISLGRQPDEEIVRIDKDPWNWRVAGRTNGFMQYGKFGTLGSVRGFVPQASVLKYYRYLEDFVKARITLAYERSRVIMKQSVAPGSREARNLLSQTQRFPAHGYMLKEIKGQLEYSMDSPNLGGADATADWTMLIHMIAGGVEVPPMILTQDADDAVYASIRAARTPFLQKIGDNREVYGNVLTGACRAAVSFAVDAGRLPEKSMVPKHSVQQVARGMESLKDILHEASAGMYTKSKIVRIIADEMGEPEEMIEVATKDIPIMAEYPDLITENPKEKAEVLTMYRNLGIVSRDTAAGMAGIDWGKEKTKIDTEKEEDKADQADAFDQFMKGQGNLPPDQKPEDQAAADDARTRQ